jgi:hypothetical protein
MGGEANEYSSTIREEDVRGTDMGGVRYNISVMGSLVPETVLFVSSYITAYQSRADGGLCVFRGTSRR